MRRVEQRVLDLRADGRKDGAGDDAGRDDAEAPRFCGGDGLGGGLHEEGSGHRRVFRESRRRDGKAMEERRSTH